MNELTSDEAARELSLSKIGANVRTRRRAVGLSQEELAFRSGLDRTYVGGVERGERNITVLSALKICGPLNCTLSELVEGVE